MVQKSKTDRILFHMYVVLYTKYLSSFYHVPEFLGGLHKQMK
jgi:hypothetical protein